jgi:hypothetical protein
MKKKRGILVVIVLLGVLAAGWLCLRPGNTVVIKGNLPPQDIAAVKSLVKKDMAKRLLPDYSWASFKALVPDIRAYFRYNIVEINSPGLGVAMVKVGDGRTVGTSKHVCEYQLIENTNSWAVHVIFSGRSLFVGNAPTIWRPPPTNRAGTMPFVAFPPAQARIPTNLTTPQISLGAGTARQNFAQPPLPANDTPPAITNSYALTLRAPATTHFISGTIPAGPGMRPPPYRGSLTNLMPLGN